MGDCSFKRPCITLSPPKIFTFRRPFKNENAIGPYCTQKTFGLLICTFDSDFRKVCQFATLEKSQVLGTIVFFQFNTHYFFQVCRPIFLYANHMEQIGLCSFRLCVRKFQMTLISPITFGKFS